MYGLGLNASAALAAGGFYDLLVMLALTTLAALAVCALWLSSSVCSHCGAPPALYVMAQGYRYKRRASSCPCCGLATRK